MENNPGKFDGGENDPLIKSVALKELDEIEHNPPAFPQQEFSRIGEISEGTIYGGMSLRDYFAAKVMQSLITEVCGGRHDPMRAGDMKDGIAFDAFDIADAMLEARKK